MKVRAVVAVAIAYEKRQSESSSEAPGKLAMTDDNSMSASSNGSNGSTTTSAIRFGSEDLHNLFPGGMHENFGKTFLETWSGRPFAMPNGPGGGPVVQLPPDDPEVFMGVPLVFCAQVMHTHGRPIANDIPVASKELRYKFVIPLKVYNKVREDKDFRYQLSAALYDCHKKQTLLRDIAPHDVCLACATRPAVGFVQQMHQCVDPRHELRRTGADVPEKSLELRVILAYPVCQELACNARLRKFLGDFTRPLGTSGRERCCICKVPEALEGPKLKRCGKCRIPCYCSKECQLKHWPVHKKECRPLKK